MNKEKRDEATETKQNIEIKVVIFLDDDNQVKPKLAKILSRLPTGAVYIQLWDKTTNQPLRNPKGNIVPAFEIPEHRLLKIKDIDTGDDI